MMIPATLIVAVVRISCGVLMFTVFEFGVIVNVMPLAEANEAPVIAPAEFAINSLSVMLVTVSPVSDGLVGTLVVSVFDPAEIDMVTPVVLAKPSELTAPAVFATRIASLMLEVVKLLMRCPTMIMLILGLKMLYVEHAAHCEFM